ncbi:MAG TPA: DSD1 family PLP-dependent enzyme [Opitutaceae bacterium]|jgi:D-serine deaminase-like pyridoxal phosphate-dependent protein
MNAIDQIRDRVRATYGGAIGRPRHYLVTPALILDLDAVRRNIEAMAKMSRNWQARLRPHYKTHKSPELARLQAKADAVGFCTATVWEAIALVQSGLENVLVANEVVGFEKISALAAEARNHRLMVAVDDPRNASDLDAALRSARGSLEVLIDVDVGMGRCGVRSSKEAVALAEHVTRLPHLRLRGVQGYEGHCMREPDREARAAKVKAAIDRLAGAAASLVRSGFACDIVSASGTGTCEWTGGDPRVTEIQAGSYLLMDRFHAGFGTEFVSAMTVLGTVVSRQGNTVVLDCGRKSVGIDFGPPALVDFPSCAPRYLAEEHVLFDLDGPCSLAVGDTAELVPGYAPSTVNLYDVFHVVENGTVVDVWPVVPRGPSHVGFLSE